MVQKLVYFNYHICVMLPEIHSVWSESSNCLGRCMFLLSNDLGRQPVWYSFSYCFRYWLKAHIHVIYTDVYLCVCICIYMYIHTYIHKHIPLIFTSADQNEMCLYSLIESSGFMFSYALFPLKSVFDINFLPLNIVKNCENCEQISI